MRSLPLYLLILASSAHAQTPDASAFDTEASRYESLIATIGKFDTKHPDHLNVQLDYAALLARYADADCAKRVSEAQAHLKVAKDNPALELVLSAAAGRVPFVGYSVEAARARCTTDPAKKTAAIRNALALAKQGVEGYRSIFAYDSMAIMQFNVAQSYFDLGDKTRAVKELEAAIELDRTYGLKEDAAENFRILRKWQGKEATDVEVVELLKTLEPRAVTLKFDWKPFRAESTSTYDLGAFETSGAKHTVFTVPGNTQLKIEGEDFALESTVGEPKFVNAISGTEQEKQVVELLARVSAKSPSILVTKQGQFKDARDMEGYSRAISADIDRMLGRIVDPADARKPQVRAAVEQSLAGFVDTEILKAKLRHKFALETSIWIDAPLKHNQWLQMTMALPMNGTPKGFMEQNLDITLARWLPCAKGMKPDSCVELIVHAKPTAASITRVAQDLEKDGKGKLEYSAETRVRLVVDPNTLMPYAAKTLEFSYLSLTNKGQRAVKIDANRRETEYRYRN